MLLNIAFHQPASGKPSFTSQMLVLGWGSNQSYLTLQIYKTSRPEEACFFKKAWYLFKSYLRNQEIKDT